MNKNIFLVVVVAILLISNVSALIWNDGLTAGLKNLWQMNETTGTNVVDLFGWKLGNQANGTINSATYVKFNEGKIGNGLNFTDPLHFGVVKLAGESYFDNLLNMSTNITLSVWIRANKLSAGSGIFCNGQNPVGDASFWCLQGQDTNDINFYMLGDSGELSVYTTGNNVVPNAWTHIVLTVDTKHNSTNGLPATNIKIYVNNVSESLTINKNNFVGGITADTADFAWIGTGFLNSSDYYWNGSIDELGIWNRTLSASEVGYLWNNGNGLTFSEDVSLITTVLKLPINSTNTTLSSYYFSANYSGQLIKSFVNATLKLWYSNGTLIDSNTSNSDNALNFTNISISNIPIEKNMLWNYYICGENITGTLCNYATANRSLSREAFIENAITFNTTTRETKRETIILNISIASGSITNVKLSYNGTNYTGTSTSSGSNYLLSATLDIPLVFENKSFYFIWDNINKYNSSMYGQYVNKTIFGICNSTLTNKFMNISFKDEGNLSRLNVSIPSSTWVYYLGSGLVNKTLSFSNNTENLEYLFCSYGDESLATKVNLQYQSTNYPQRLYQDILSLSNINTNKTLYLLGSENGIYVTFKVSSPLGSPITGVSVVGNRTIGGVSTIVALGTTDSGGLVTFWLNSDYEHTFSFVKTGYSSEILNLYPTQSAYTVTLGGGTTSPNILDYLRDVRITIKPTSSYLKNNTEYNFNMTISTSYWLFDSWGFVLKYGNGSVIGTQTSTSDVGGILSLTADTLNQTRIVMEYYYVVNSTYINKTKIWQVSKSNSFSIFHLFEDLNAYSSANMYGIKGEDGTDTFGKALISVIILVSLAGILGYKFGIASEQAILGIIFGLILLLNSLDFIPNPDFLTKTGIELGDFLVVLVGLIVVASIFKGAKR